MICTPKVGQTFGGAYHFRCFIFDKRVFLHHLICRHTAFRTKRNFPAAQRTTLLTFFHLGYLHKNKSEPWNRAHLFTVPLYHSWLRKVYAFLCRLFAFLFYLFFLSTAVFFLSTKFFFRHILYSCKNTKLLTKRILSIIINTIRN